jgi:hypothetical protein
MSVAAPYTPLSPLNNGGISAWVCFSRMAAEHPALCSWRKPGERARGFWRLTIRIDTWPAAATMNWGIRAWIA